MKFVIPGHPIAWARPIPSRNSTRCFNPQIKERDRVQWILRSQYCGPVHNGPIILKITFTFLGNEDEIHEDVPDTDNLLKFLLDCLQGVIISNDKRIPTLYAHKRKGPQEMTEIEVFDATTTYFEVIPVKMNKPVKPTMPKAKKLSKSKDAEIRSIGAEMKAEVKKKTNPGKRTKYEV